MPEKLQNNPFAEFRANPFDEFRADPFAEFRGAAPASRMGDTAELPRAESHPELGFKDRFAVMFRGGNPAAGQRYLEEKGFQVQPKGGYQYALRKGTGPWYHFDEPGLSLEDVSDVAGDVVSIGGMIGGAAIGTAAGAPTGPGAFAAGVAGAGVGSAAAQGLRTLAGEAMGVPSRAEEIPGELLEEGVAGAAGQVLGAGAGKLLGAAGRGLAKWRQGAQRTRAIRNPIQKATPKPSPDPTLPAEVPPGQTALDQKGWEYFVRNHPETAKLVAKAAKAKEVKLPAGEAVSREVMVKALKDLKPTDPAVVQFIRKETSRRTGAEKGTLRTMLFQQRPELNRRARAIADMAAGAQAKGSRFSHLTRTQHADLIYRQMVHGLSPKTFDEVLSLSKGMATDKIDDMISGLSHRFPYIPQQHGILGPVMDVEARRAQIAALGRVPIGSEVDFWRSIPLEGLRKLQLPDGRILELSVDQAKAARHIVSDIVMHGVPFREKVSKALIKLGEALKAPRRVLYTAFRSMGMGWAQDFLMARPWLRYASAATGVRMGGLMGLGVAGTEAASLLGGGITNIGKALVADRSGGILKSVLGSASMGLARRIQSLLKLLEGGPARQAAYRAGIFQLLSNPEFQQLMGGKTGAPAGG